MEKLHVKGWGWPRSNLQKVWYISLQKSVPGASMVHYFWSTEPKTNGDSSKGVKPTNSAFDSEEVNDIPERRKSNPFHKPSPLKELEMVHGPPPGITHTLEGAGIMDSLSTSKQFGGVADQAGEWNFILFHLNTVMSTEPWNQSSLGWGLYCIVRASLAG